MLTGMRINKSAGPTDVFRRILDPLAVAVARSVCSLIRGRVKQKSIPVAWMQTNVVVIGRSGHRSVADN